MLASRVLPLAVLVAWAARASLAANAVWLEAEQFRDCGGWTNDAQFIDQMGSPYLLAVGLGTPVRDAVTTLDLPATGRYRLWARTRDWVPAHHPGRFHIILQGRRCPQTFGASGQPGWQWEDGGVHALSGKVDVRLRDLTGYYGRCDALVLTDDLEWTPPREAEPLATVRREHGGSSLQVLEMGHFDVVVVGGGLAGCVAAVSAARRRQNGADPEPPRPRRQR